MLDLPEECQHFLEFNGKLYAPTSTTQTFESAHLECLAVSAQMLTFKTADDYQVMKVAYSKEKLCIT